MKRLFLLLMIFGINQALLQGQDQALNEYFGFQAGNPDYTYISVLPKMFELLRKSNFNDARTGKVKAALSGLEKAEILSYPNEKTKEGKYEALKKRLQNIPYSIYARYDNDTVQADFYVKAPGYSPGALYILSKNNKQRRVVRVIGDINMNEITTLANLLDIKEIKYLEKINP